MKTTHVHDLDELIDDQLIDARAAARLLGLSVRTVRDMASRRDLPIYKIGRSVRFHLSDIKTWREERKVPSSRPRTSSPMPRQTPTESAAGQHGQEREMSNKSVPGTRKHDQKLALEIVVQDRIVDLLQMCDELRDEGFTPAQVLQQLLEYFSDHGVIYPIALDALMEHIYR